MASISTFDRRTRFRFGEHVKEPVDLRLRVFLLTLDLVRFLLEAGRIGQQARGFAQKPVEARRVSGNARNLFQKKKGMVHPLPAQPRSLNGFASSRMDVTEAEGYILDVLRQARKAEKSRETFTRFVAWEMLQAEVEAQRMGVMPHKIDTDSNPTLYAAVAAIQSYLASEQAKTKTGAKKAKRRTDAESADAPKQAA